MDEDRMSGAEFRVYRLLLGKNERDLGIALARRRVDGAIQPVNERTIRRWENGREPIPYRVLDQLLELLDVQIERAGRIAEAGRIEIERGALSQIAATAIAWLKNPDLMIDWAPGEGDG